MPDTLLFLVPGAVETLSVIVRVQVYVAVRALRVQRWVAVIRVLGPRPGEFFFLVWDELVPYKGVLGIVVLLAVTAR